MLFTKFFFLLSILSIFSSTFFASADTTCQLSQNSPGEAIIPLSYCSDSQTYACCNSLQDSFIESQVNSIFTSNCAGRYPNLKIYYCMGCSGYQPSMTTGTTPKALNVCKTWFQEKIWGTDLNSKTIKYDACGMNVSVHNALTTSVISPSTVYNTAYEFILDIKPILLEGYTINLTDTNCLSSPIMNVFMLIYQFFILWLVC